MTGPDTSDEHLEADDGQTAVRQLAAYLPATLVGEIVTSGLPPVATPHHFEAAVLLADISGFTPLSEELASDGPRGAEELSRVLRQIFEPMLDVIDACGGTVSHFYGDAMVVYFPATPQNAGTVARTALACAGHVQQLMLTRFRQVRTTRPPGQPDTFPLQMKIGASFGDCLAVVVGERSLGLEFVLAGTAVDLAATAEKAAASGQVVATARLRAAAGLPADETLAPVDAIFELPPAAPILDLPAIPVERRRRLLADAAPFVPPALFQRILTAGAAAPADHRPVTSLFVTFEGLDVAAPEGPALLQQFYVWAMQVVARFGAANGRVNRILTGDKGTQLHIMFGAPVAPDAPEQAVRCALALQREKPYYISRQKIGIVCGRVFAGPLGSGRRQEYTIVGDTVNLSARIAGVCPAGDVLVDPSTAARIRRALELTPLPPVTLKGKARPVPLFRAEGEQGGRIQLASFLQRRRQRPFVGRRRQLELLQTILDRALQGEGNVALVTGPIGSGKSQFVGEGIRHWLAAGGTGFSGVCREDTARVPYAPWLGMWREWFDLRNGVNAADGAEQVVRLTQLWWPAAGDDVGLWGEVLGLPIPQSESVERLSPEVRRERFFFLVRHCLAALTTQHPQLLIFEDIHHSDQASLDLLASVATHGSHLRLCLVATEASGASSRLATSVEPTIIEVDEFSVAEARRYVQARLGSAQVPDAIWAHLGLDRDAERERLINPLFLEEILSDMLASEVVVANGRLRVDESRLAALRLPDNIQGLFLARLDRLAPAARDMLLVATVIGEEFDEPMLGGMLAWPPEHVAERLRQLERAGIARQIAHHPAPVYFFQHAMLRDAAYSSLNYVQRQALHADAGHYLEATYGDNLRPHVATLANHFGQTDLHEKGVQYAVAAGDDAKAIFANREAIAFYNMAERHLSHDDTGQQWETLADLLLARSVTHRLLGDFSLALADVERALEVALQRDDILRAAQAYNWQAEYCFLQTRYDDVLTITAHVIEELGEIAPPSEIAKAYQWAGMAHNSRRRTDDIPEALRCLSRAEEIAREIADDGRLGRIYFSLAQYFYMQDEFNEALLAMQAGIRLADSFTTSVNITIAHNNIAQVLIRLGRREEALDALSQAITMAADSSRYLYARFTGNKAAVLAQLGHYDEAEPLFEEAEALLTAEDNAYGLVEVYLSRAYELHVARANWIAATEALAKAEQLITRQPDSYPEELLRLKLAQGAVALADGRLDDADRFLTQAQLQVKSAQLPWWGGAVAYYSGLVFAAAGDMTRAHAQLALSLAALEAGANPDYRPLVLLALAEVEKDKDVQERLLADCLHAARSRARAHDRQRCYKQGGSLLRHASRSEWRELAQSCLAEVAVR